jgi:hypothetical protein
MLKTSDKQCYLGIYINSYFVKLVSQNSKGIVRELITISRYSLILVS